MGITGIYGHNEIPKQHNKIVDSRRVVPSNMLLGQLSPSLAFVGRPPLGIDRHVSQKYFCNPHLHYFYQGYLLDQLKRITV